MVRHASSHGFSVLMCTILSAFLIDLLRPVLPRFMSYLEDTSNYIVTVFSLPFSVQQFNVVLVASILAMFWGIFFKLQNKKYYSRK